ncbi:Nramp family divalent metal transporter [Anaeromyxobacter diazotrophicus]|uniref:Mn transporter n=1 Tax=Anaeromyxobacter diazotrophicus TaxID=2590199 RepID=A0A7I9VIV3_9BACT|nr:Nramp family divalent metal transporter [Anaeromyxobacter diazotrophicus]GEJ56334.1 Mn transporter [Anaeromyxobacter diazotrophicus]
MTAEPQLAATAAAPRRHLWRNVLVFLSVVGPGIITANVDNDAGGITVYSLAGAQYGTRLLWTLLPITVALIVVQEMSARMGVMTGKGLADLIRESYGVKVTFWIMLALLVADVGNTIAEFSGVAASVSIFGVPPWISVPLTALAVWLLVLKGTYRQVEKVFLVACVFYVAYPVSAILSHPDWGAVLKETVTPRFEAGGGYAAMLIGVVGTTIAPWMQFYLQSAVVEKGIKPEHYKHSRLDVIVGCVITDVVAFFIIAACAATLFKAGVKVDTADQAAQALAPLAGRYASWLFAFGLYNASFFAASILPLATAYYICEAFGWESGIDKKWGEARQFYGLYTGIVALGAAVVLVPHLPLLKIMLVSQVVNGMLLPFILIFMLLLVNKPKLMGEHRNGPWFNAIAWATTAIMIVLTLYLVATGVRDLFA